MTEAGTGHSLRERMLGHPSGAATDRCAALADMADAFVANTLETICEFEAARHGTAADPAVARRLAELRAKLDGLDDLIVELRELRRQARD